MNPTWQRFLQQQGAHCDAQGCAHFAERLHSPEGSAAEGALCDLSHEGLISVTGPDAQTFLQGQLTQDLRKVGPSCSPLAAYCSGKGRVLAVIRVGSQTPQSYWLRLPAACVDAVIKRLRMYVLRAQVVLTVASEEVVGLGLVGEKAVRAVESGSGVTLPQEVDATKPVGELQYIRLPGAIPRFLVQGTPSAAATLWQPLAPVLRLTDVAFWDGLEIQAGIPVIVPDTSDKFVPQMLNLEKLGAVSFTKGCYVGQEIVARSQYLGEVKRRLFTLQGAGALPQLGERVYGLLGQEQGVGEIIRVAPARETGGFIALAVMNQDAPRQLSLGNGITLNRVG